MLGWWLWFHSPSRAKCLHGAPGRLADESPLHLAVLWLCICPQQPCGAAVVFVCGGGDVGMIEALQCCYALLLQAVLLATVSQLGRQG